MQLSGTHGDGWTDPIVEAVNTIRAAMEKADIRTYYLVLEGPGERVLVGAKGKHGHILKIVQEGIAGLEFEATKIVDEHRAAVRQTGRNDPSGS